MLDVFVTLMIHKSYCYPCKLKNKVYLGDRKQLETIDLLLSTSLLAYHLSLCTFFPLNVNPL